MAGVDKQRVGDTFARHYRQYDDHATVQRAMAARLAAALAEAAPGLVVRRALEIGIGTGFLTRLLTQRYPLAEWWFNDLSPAAFDWIPAGLRQAVHLPGDAETLPYPARLDLLATSSALQWFDDLPAFFHKALGVLQAGGTLAIATFGENNMRELRELGGTALSYPGLDSLRSMAAEAGMRVLRAEEWEERLFFPTVRDVLEHLRHTGVNGAAGRMWTPARLRAFEEAYRDRFAATDDSLPLTYHPLLLIAQAPA